MLNNNSRENPIGLLFFIKLLNSSYNILLNYQKEKKMETKI